ncbi:MAG: DJ-1/PfpI family protein [Oscillospiraceae bacterium]|jgi:4-methyl-5(b-hydroxyethyl)-thiazole monophosphate biosynthesis|nr:DJ-1/PfpI family protein [Oscillospiraceae bacterium]
MVYAFLADGFEEAEAIVPIDIMRRCGIETATVGVTGEYVTSSRNITVKADITIDGLNCENARMVFLPGGMPGTENLKKSEKVIGALKYCAASGIYIAAICAAPSVPGMLGLLKGKKATCYPGWEDKLTGAEYVDKPVVSDGKFITGNGAGAAFEFGFAIAEILAGKEKSRQVFKAMLCK